MLSMPKEKQSLSAGYGMWCDSLVSRMQLHTIYLFTMVWKIKVSSEFRHSKISVLKGKRYHCYSEFVLFQKHCHIVPKHSQHLGSKYILQNWPGTSTPRVQKIGLSDVLGCRAWLWEESFDERYTNSLISQLKLRNYWSSDRLFDIVNHLHHYHSRYFSVTNRECFGPKQG